MCSDIYFGDLTCPNNRIFKKKRLKSELYESSNWVELGAQQLTLQIGELWCEAKRVVYS